MMLRKTFLFFIMVLLSGCATNRHIPLLPVLRGNINETEVRLILSQESIFADYNRQSSHTNGEGGALGGLIIGIFDAVTNSSRQSEADEIVTPARNILAGYDVKAPLRKYYQHELGKVNWLNSKKISLHAENSSEEEKLNTANQSRANAVIFVNVIYYLSKDMSFLNVKSDVVMYSGDEKLSALAKNNGAAPSLLYRNTYTYSHPVPVAEGISVSGSDAIVEWVGDDGRGLKRAISEGIKKSAAWLAADLQSNRSGRS